MLENKAAPSLCVTTPGAVRYLLPAAPEALAPVSAHRVSHQAEAVWVLLGCEWHLTVFVASKACSRVVLAVPGWIRLCLLTVSPPWLPLHPDPEGWQAPGGCLLVFPPRHRSAVGTPGWPGWIQDCALWPVCESEAQRPSAPVLLLLSASCCLPKPCSGLGSLMEPLTVALCPAGSHGQKSRIITGSDLNCRALPRLHEPPNRSITSPSSSGEDVSHQRQQQVNPRAV